MKLIEVLNLGAVMADEWAGKMKCATRKGESTEISIGPDEAAIVFKADGLHALLPNNVDLNDLLDGKVQDLPWFLWAAAVALEAMDEALRDTYNNGLHETGTEEDAAEALTEACGTLGSLLMLTNAKAGEA